MQDSHIVSSFDRDLEGVQAQLMKMGGLVEKALLDAAEALELRDEALAGKVRAGDKAIDGLEELIQTECARIIAQRAPTASDLRTVLTVMRLATALERAGDYAKNLAKRSLVLMGMAPVGTATGTVRRMAKLVVQQMSDALDAYIARDVVRAREIRARDQEIDQMYSGLFRQLLTYMLEDPRTITACMHLHFIAKNIERVGDHATGIAEQVIYLVEGELPSDDRPKHDAVSEAI